MLLSITVFYIDNSKKYLKSRENWGLIEIIPRGLGIFRSQNTENSKNKNL